MKTVVDRLLLYFEVALGLERLRRCMVTWASLIHTWILEKPLVK